MCTVTGFTSTLNKAYLPADALDDLAERTYKVAYDYKVMWEEENTLMPLAKMAKTSIK